MASAQPLTPPEGQKKGAEGEKWENFWETDSSMGKAKAAHKQRKIRIIHASYQSFKTKQEQVEQPQWENK